MLKTHTIRCLIC